jgi:hypothetical protein
MTITIDDNKANLFLYSLILPVLWLALGVVVNAVAPGKGLGAIGHVLLLGASTAFVSWLFVRKCRRDFSAKERWMLTGWFFLWSFTLEALGLWYVLNAPDAQIALERGAILVTLAITALLDFGFAWAVVKYWSPRFIKWQLNRLDSVSRDP